MPKSVSVMVDGIEQGKDKKEFDSYEVKRAIDVIIEAGQVMENKALMKEVQKQLDKASSKVSSIADLRKMAGGEKPKPGDNLYEKSTPDDEAEEESKEKRVKNSANPTIVGRQLK